MTTCSSRAPASRHRWFGVLSYMKHNEHWKACFPNSHIQTQEPPHKSSCLAVYKAMELVATRLKLLSLYHLTCVFFLFFCVLSMSFKRQTSKSPCGLLDGGRLIYPTSPDTQWCFHKEVPLTPFHVGSGLILPLSLLAGLMDSRKLFLFWIFESTQLLSKVQTQAEDSK